MEELRAYVEDSRGSRAGRAFQSDHLEGPDRRLSYPAARSEQDYSRDRAAVLKARSVRFLYQEQ
jgi:hypothetical protein